MSPIVFFSERRFSSWARTLPQRPVQLTRQPPDSRRAIFILNWIIKNLGRKYHVWKFVCFDNVSNQKVKRWTEMISTDQVFTWNQRHFFNKTVYHSKVLWNDNEWNWKSWEIFVNSKVNFEFLRKILLVIFKITPFFSFQDNFLGNQDSRFDNKIIHFEQIC